MLRNNKLVKDIILAIIIISLSFVLSIFFQNELAVDEHITTIFVFAIFIISYISDGYILGIISSLLSVLLINFAFTYPYFSLDFTNIRSLISALIMIVVSILTSMLTTRIKENERVKMEVEKERMRANLLRAISHDLRTPLTTIYSSANLLIEEKISSDKQRAILKGIKEDADWLVHMVENLLSITRIDSSEFKINKQAVVLDELIDDVLIKYKKRYKDGILEVNIPEDIIIIPMDATLIVQVLLNLLDNAMQHALSLTSLKLNVYTKEDLAIFEVSDNGCGLNVDDYQQLFKPKLSTSKLPSDANKHNLGIGLSLCSTIIKAHGSKLEAYKNESGGATFSFALKMEELDGE